jgi:hypothetical protein
MERPLLQALRSGARRRQILRMRLWPRRSNGKTEADAAIKTLAAGGDRWAPLAKLAETTP